MNTMWKLLFLLVLVTCLVSTISAGGRGKGKGHEIGKGKGHDKGKGKGHDSGSRDKDSKDRDHYGRCKPSEDSSDSSSDSSSSSSSEEDEIPFEVEPVSQLRTLVGDNTVDVGACPLGTCRFDLRRHKRCPDDGYICPVTEEKDVDLGQFGIHTINFVTACKCCKDNGIAINGQVVDATTGASIADAELRITETSPVLSGSDGSFSMIVSSDNTRVVINAVSAGYIDAMKVVEIPEGFRGPVDVVVAMVRMAEPVDIDATVENELSVSGDQADPNDVRALITIPARSFRTLRGVYRGVVKASLTFIDTSNPDVEEEIPGIFLTANGEPLETTGIFALNYWSETGEPLNMGPVTVSVGVGWKIWTLNSEGLWSPIGSAQGRKRRQVALTDDFQTSLENGQWVNIDKIPGAPRCYFKGRIFDESSGTEITSSSTASFKPYIISYRIQQNQRLPFYTTSTSDPATTCYEVRCPVINNPNNTLVGLITMKSYETVLVGGISIPVVTPLNPRSLADYSPLIQPSLNDVQYSILSNDEDLYVNFISDASGPFYTVKNTCESSTIDEPSFHFLKPVLPSYIPYPDDTELCTARIGFFDNNNFFYTLSQLDDPISVIAISTWSINGDGYYYTDTAYMEFSSLGGDFVFACITYRCSTTDASTTVLLDFQVPNITVSYRRGNQNQSVEYEVAAFNCYGNCTTQDCFKNGDGATGANGAQGTSIDGSFVAPVLNNTVNGPDFFWELPNDCDGKGRNDKFAAMYYCYGSNFPNNGTTAGQRF